MTTQDEFIDVFKGLSQMPEGLILDVQGNGGGYMGAALFLAEQFLERGQLILYTGRKSIDSSRYEIFRYGILHPYTGSRIGQ